MSIPNRIWNISKAYVNQVRDRIDDALAEKELEAGSANAGLPDYDDASPDAMMQRAQARIDNARRELEARQANAAKVANNEETPASRPEPTPVTTTPDDPNLRDYKVLGLPPGSDLSQVVSKYEELVNRCDPRRFPEGSEEQKTAALILVRVNASYDALRKRLDPTENRFGKLELE